MCGLYNGVYELVMCGCMIEYVISNKVVSEVMYEAWLGGLCVLVWMYDGLSMMFAYRTGGQNFSYLFERFVL